MKFKTVKAQDGKWIWQFKTKVYGHDFIIDCRYGRHFPTKKAAEQNALDTVEQMMKVLIEKDVTTKRRVLRDWF